MGIDIYAQWRDMSHDEKTAQMTGFRIDAGETGYLREAYHGEPYVTRFLVREAFENKNQKARIPAATLKDRLPDAVLLAIYREQTVYRGQKVETFKDMREALEHMFGGDGIAKALRGDDAKAMASNITQHQREEIMRLVKARKVPPVAMAFADFVDLVERKETETGETCTIVASY